MTIEDRSLRFCAHCGRERPPVGRFCTGCGADLHHEAASQPAPGAAPTSAVAAASEASPGSPVTPRSATPVSPTGGPSQPTDAWAMLRLDDRPTMIDLAFDVGAVALLLAGLVLPWLYDADGHDLARVIGASAFALAAVLLPYLRGFVAAPAVQDPVQRGRLRALLCVPYALAVALALVIDAVERAGVGAGVILGAAGALLATLTRHGEPAPQPFAQWPVHKVAGIAAAVVAAAATVDVVRLLAAYGTSFFLSFVVAFAWLAVAFGWSARGLLRGSTTAAGLLVILGSVVGLAVLLAADSGVGSVRDPGAGLILAPIVGVLGAATLRAAQRHRESPALLWFDLTAAVLALFVLAAGLVVGATLIDLRLYFDKGPAIRVIVIAAAIGAAAWYCLTVLRRSPLNGRTPTIALGAGGLFLSLVMWAIEDSSTPQTWRAVSLGIFAFLVMALTAPPSVRRYVEAHRAASSSSSVGGTDA